MQKGKAILDILQIKQECALHLFKKENIFEIVQSWPWDLECTWTDKSYNCREDWKQRLDNSCFHKR